MMDLFGGPSTQPMQQQNNGMGDLMSMGGQTNNLADLFGSTPSNNLMGGNDLLSMGGSPAPMGTMFG